MNLTFGCAGSNDLYRVLADSGYKCARFAGVAEAVEHAEQGSAVLILADGYPEKQTNVDAAMFKRAAEKKLKLYVEYPASIPGLEIGSPESTNWERVVVASGKFGAELPKLRIVSVSGCRFLSVKADDPLLVVARVAGFDTAAYGIPDNAHPLLFEMPERNVIIATTKLSGFISGRYAPSEAWGVIWERILRMLDPGQKVALKWTPDVHPVYGPNEKLPDDVELRTIKEAAAWYLNSRLLVSSRDKQEVEQLLKSGAETRLTPAPDRTAGDGSFGILEGYSAGIRHDGSQVQRVPLRADCNAEVAMALALNGAVSGDKRSEDIAKNLLDYVYFKSEMQGGVRGNPKHPAFGLVAWGAISPAWEVANYGDDDARVILATMTAAACLKSDKWDEPLLKALLSNLRTTGTLGFRGDRIDIPALEERGWKAYHDAATVNLSPHFEAYLWACYLWAYGRTGYRPFIENTRTGIKTMMEGYPDKWRWNDTSERAQMLLPLAWLVRVEDTSEHRGWLKKIADDLIALQQPSGAIPERLGGTGGGHYNIPQSNEAYGTGETPLIQSNNDPATDQLYTTGFALLSLHEAAAATGDKKIKDAEDKLARYLCRIQVKSAKYPNLNGTWFRAFDYNRWDYWASSADAGWGAWAAETGWGPAWIASMLGMRAQNQSIWDLTSGSRIADRFKAVHKLMTENDGGPWKPEAGR